MATLTMQPIGPAPGAPAVQEGARGVTIAEDGGDLGDIDSGWVFLGKSDIVPADLAAAAAAAARGGRSLSTIPTWARWVLGGVVYTVVPFYKRVRNVEDETVGRVETAVEVVEHIAEVTEKLAANVADQLPEDGSLQKALEKVEHFAEVVDKDAENVEDIVKKVCPVGAVACARRCSPAPAGLHLLPLISRVAAPAPGDGRRLPPQRLLLWLQSSEHSDEVSQSKARNAEYNSKRFAAVIMRIRDPKTTTLIFASGKMVCTGAKSEEH